ncbi:alpha/beta hydrolase [Trichothermofontia sichuanensis B231]|uniref:alpha/beta hydrolase n=1 Tax=Trichothermofontia sichuanensis TaxID=3045816 RepID=UPI0022477F01|nr:alpha/beta hydrolase [Trichothermofontia sichuanensis]UZQ54109.1 alpha/beta hydrolase [Trichothermofontia sichuanensis B231]
MLPSLSPQRSLSQEDVSPQRVIARNARSSNGPGFAGTCLLADRPLPRAWPYVAIGLLTGLLTVLPARAAEQVNVTLGPFARSLPISSLEQFVKAGTVDPDLRPFIRFLKPQAREDLRQALGQHKPISASVLSQLLQDPMGEMMLQRTGQIVQTSAGLNGAQALRSALVLAAGEPEGISLLNFLRHFPTHAVRLDLNRVLRIYRHSARFVHQTEAFVRAMQQMSATTAATAAARSVDRLMDLRQPGPYPVVFQPLQLEDSRRQRTYPADLYLPQTLSQLTAVPVVIISHGLGSSRTHFREFAQHLASYGFAVALPEHIGSNEAQKQAVMAWKAREVFQVSEFLDRPLDVSFLLDQLDHYNRTELGARLNLQQVAVVGHSFGGYTALALGGATVDFDHLANRCQPTTSTMRRDDGYPPPACERELPFAPRPIG